MAELVDAHDLPAGRQAQDRIIIMYHVYAIKSKNKNYIYVGISDNPIRRIKQHNLGYNITTKPYRPFVPILFEEYNNRQDARKREKFLKSGCGKELLKNTKKYLPLWRNW